MPTIAGHADADAGLADSGCPQLPQVLSVPFRACSAPFPLPLLQSLVCVCAFMHHKHKHVHGGLDTAFNAQRSTASTPLDRQVPLSEDTRGCRLALACIPHTDGRRRGVRYTASSSLVGQRHRAPVPVFAYLCVRVPRVRPAPRQSRPEHNGQHNISMYLYIYLKRPQPHLESTHAQLPL